MTLLRKVAVLSSLLPLLALPALATTIVMPTDAQLVDKSPLIVRGTVERSEAVEIDGGIWTETALRVEKVLKGEARERVIIREVGGRVGERFTVVFGSPVYRTGERVLVFLWPTRRGDYQTRDLFVGKFSERHAADGRRLWLRPEGGPGTHLLGPDFEPAPPGKVLRSAPDFERFIEDRAKGAGGSSDYVVSDATVLDSGTADFTLIVEPTVYRWFAFDNGSSVSWRSYGSQPGYSNGGVNELSTGMSSWTSYTSAKIRYSYAGAGTGTPGGLSSANGVNEVIFNDLNNEIDGSWNSSTGGVVGRGGFNNVRYGGSWTAPFTADATHTAGAKSAYDILEGNLVIQDGVSPSAGISSTVLAEILAHEFGHTLGFGHSADTTALMYSSVTRLGPALRSDDQLAARWLYPSSSGTSPGTPPAAPSSLTATAGTNQIHLAWRDNASDETAQSIYLAAGSGAFSRAGDVAANVTSTTINVSGGRTYSVYVTAKNGYGESQPSNTVSVTVPSSTVTASFTVSPTSGTAGSTVFTFYDQSTGPVASRVWSFGDGTTSNLASPTHVYASAGTFTITLTVNNGSGQQSSASRSVVVYAPASSVTANFSWSPASPTVDTTIAFADASSGSPTSWQWSFGDGTTSTQRHPQKRYAAAGVYSVTLRVSNGSTSAQTSKSISIASGTPAVTPVSTSFVFSPTSPATGQAVTFSDRSTGAPTAWAWNFGDGRTSSQQNPTHAFAAPGSYHVTLSASNASSSSSYTAVVTVIAGVEPYRSLIPVSAQVAGASGTEWRTDLTIFNAGTSGATVTFRYLPAGGGAALTRSVFLAAGSSRNWSNALRDLFGLSSGAGALDLESSDPVATPFIRVTSRTYTGGSTGTYGQLVAAEVPTTSSNPLWITGIASSASFRTNVGIVNRAAAAASAALTLTSPDGAVLGRTSLSIPAGSLHQAALTSLFPSLVGAALPPGLTLRVDRSGSGIRAYASVVDNVSQDPVFIPATEPPSGQELMIPAVARAEGASSTFWRSDVTLFNPAATATTVSFRFLAAGADNRYASARSISIPAGRAVAIRDIVAWMSASGTGSLMMTWNGAAGPVVTSRTYTTRSDGGTFGQSIAAGEIARWGNRTHVVGLKGGAAFRSNVGFVNASDRAIGVNVDLLSPSGAVIGSAFVTLQAKSQLQYAAATLFPGVAFGSLSDYVVRARTEVPSGLFAYGSVVDNVSGDPVFVRGE